MELSDLQFRKILHHSLFEFHETAFLKYLVLDDQYFTIHFLILLILNVNTNFFYHTLSILIIFSLALHFSIEIVVETIIIILNIFFQITEQ